MEREFELEEGEVVLKEVRKHWLLFALQLVPYAFLAALPLALPLLLPLVPQAGITFAGWGTPLGTIALGAWWLVLWSSAFTVFTRYFLNAWIITNKRIVEMEQHSYFHREVSSLLLGRIQDVTTDTAGLLHSLLDIGDINVQTAGSVDRFTMANVPDPDALRDLILAQVAQHAPTL